MILLLKFGKILLLEFSLIQSVFNKAKGQEYFYFTTSLILILNV